MLICYGGVISHIKNHIDIVIFFELLRSKLKIKMTTFSKNSIGWESRGHSKKHCKNSLLLASMLSELICFWLRCNYFPLKTFCNIIQCHFHVSDSIKDSLTDPKVVPNCLSRECISFDKQFDWFWSKGY